MKKTATFLLAFIIFTYANGQTVYSNGQLSTGAVAKDGTTAPEGYSWSELQNNSSENEATNSDLGFPGYTSSEGFSFSLADNFTVPENDNWSITSISVFAYAINQSANLIQDIKLQIWNKEPGTQGAEVIYGDMETNRFNSSSEIKIYRIQNTLFYNNAANFQRRIFKINASVNITLPAGDYWLEWQTTTLDSSVHFSPAVIVDNKRTVETFNAKMYDFSIDKWYSIKDVGAPDSAAVINVSQDLPFEISYDKVLPLELLNFAGKKINNSVVLQWNTANEINNKGFEIERKGTSGIFTKIGYVESINTSTENNYSFTDNYIQRDKKYFYRLKQVNVNGLMKYSEIIEVSTGSSNSIWVSPTIASSIISIHFSEESESLKYAYISDAHGKNVMDVNIKSLPGSGIDINVAHLARGIYFIVLQPANGARQTIRFLKN